MEHILKLLIDCDQNLVSILLLIVELETLAPFWAISNTPTHQSSTLAWEKLVILDQI